MKRRIALDSGAFTMFMKYGIRREGIEHSDFSFYESEKFAKIFDNYVTWALENKDKLTYYVSLDVPFNPELSWKLYQQLKAKGLNPMPVVHYSEDLKWLKKYMDETDYIGIGGVGGRQCTIQQYVRWGDPVFKMLGAPVGGAAKPSHRIHGFALTQFDVLQRYYWFSVDSTTCWRAATNGSFVIPQVQVHGKKITYDYTGRPFWFPCTARRGGASANIHKSGDLYQKIAREYIASLHLEFNEMSESYIQRNAVSFHYFYQAAQQLGEKRDYPFLFYCSGRPAGSSKDAIKEVLRLIKNWGCREINYLGTFADLRTYTIFRGLLEEVTDENQDPIKSTKRTRPVIRKTV